MTTPLPWSYSALSDFINCGHAYHEKRVAKRFKQADTEEKDWGKIAHKHFENYLDADVPLPPSLREHKDYIDRVIKKHDGILFTEMEGALDRQLKPVSDKWSKDIWFRVVLDVLKVIRDGENALVVDYKTGKVREGMEKQNMLFAIYVWHLFPKVNIVDTRLYFLPTGQEIRHVYAREQEDELWGHFVPDLRQYVTAFKTNTWQKRPSGLCNGYCEVTDCEFWKPRRTWRR